MSRKTTRKTRGRRLVTRVQLAQELECDPRTVAKWLEEGLPVHTRGRGGRASRYDLTAVRAWKRKREDSASIGGDLDPSQERARRDRAQTLLVEQQLKTRARDLLSATEVEKLWAAEVAAVRAQALAVPTTYADRVYRAATLEGLAGVERALRDAVYSLLRELAGRGEQTSKPEAA